MQRKCSWGPFFHRILTVERRRALVRHRDYLRYDFTRVGSLITLNDYVERRRAI